MTRITCLILLIFALTIKAHNQESGSVFEELTLAEGLTPYKNMLDIYQDRQGFIWIGSVNALQKYDGYGFNKYHALTAVIHLTEDRNRLLWMSGINGISVMDPVTEDIWNYTPDSLQTRFNKTLEDSDGTIWAAHHTLGLIKFETRVSEMDWLRDSLNSSGIGGTYQVSIYPIGNISTGMAGSIWDVFQDSLGRLWIGTSYGLFIFNKQNSTFVRVYSTETVPFDAEVFAISEDRSGKIWFRTITGMTALFNIEVLNDSLATCRFDTYPCPQYSDPQFPLANGFTIDSKDNFWLETPYHGLVKMTVSETGLPVFTELYPDAHDPGYTYGAIYSVMEDRTGILWVSHEYQGIKKFRDQSKTFIPMENLLSSFPILRYDFNSILGDTDGNLWICSWGNGIFRIAPEGKVEQILLTDPSQPDTLGNYAISMIETSKGIFMIGGVGIWQFDANTGTRKKIMDAGSYIDVLEKAGEYILIGTREEGLWTYHLATGELQKYNVENTGPYGLLSNQICTVNSMQNGDIWIGTENGGLCRANINHSSGRLIFKDFNGYLQPVMQQIKEEQAVIYEILQIENEFWFGSSQGLIMLDTLNEISARWTEEDGLLWDLIYFIEKDDQGILWLGTPHGLSALDPVSGHIKTFGKGDGLPDVRHAPPGHYKDKNDMIYLGGVGGFYRFEPENMIKQEIIPPIVITDVRMFNTTVKRNLLDSGNVFKYNENDISFSFAVLDFNNPSKNKYRYRLEGYQEDWTDTDASNRTATYTNLNPGRYRFQVMGSNEDGVWNEEGATISFTIIKPFWNTAVAFLLYGILLILLIRIIIFWRTRYLKNEKALLETQISDRTVALKAANLQMERQQQELEKVNTLLKDQKEELLQQKEELQTTVENLQKAQEQLVEAEKMAALGGLVAGVSHELNTPVGIGITAVSHLLQEIQKMADVYKNDEITHKDFREFLQSSMDTSEILHKNLERTAGLIQSFKQVSVDQTSEQQRIFNFRDYLDDIISSLNPKFRKKDVVIQIECDPGMDINSYPGAFAQIFTNLVLNSMKYGFPDRGKGKVTIKAHRKNGILHIQYLDDGKGISEDNLPHIFEPFFTSDKQKGTGLGMNIVYNLVRQKLNGKISCDSAPGKGVLFKIDIPVQGEE